MLCLWELCQPGMCAGFSPGKGRRKCPMPNVQGPKSGKGKHRKPIYCGVRSAECGVGEHRRKCHKEIEDEDEDEHEWDTLKRGHRARGGRSADLDLVELGAGGKVGGGKGIGAVGED